MPFSPTFRVEMHALPTLTLTQAQVFAGTPDGAAPAHHAFDAVATTTLIRRPEVLTAARCNF
jgi:hypothetical protein